MFQSKIICKHARDISVETFASVMFKQNFDLLEQKGGTRSGFVLAQLPFSASEFTRCCLMCS